MGNYLNHNYFFYSITQNTFLTRPDLIHIVINLTSLYYRKLPCCNRHHFLSLLVFVTLLLICRNETKLGHRAATSI